MAPFFSSRQGLSRDTLVVLGRKMGFGDYLLLLQIRANVDSWTFREILLGLEAALGHHPGALTSTGSTSSKHGFQYYNAFPGMLEQPDNK